MFQGDFRWLRCPPRLEYQETELCDALQELQRQTDTLGLCLPEPFVRFMADFSLQGTVDSCTGCWWDLSKTPVPSRLVEGIYAVRFLRDQQDCLFWYLLLGPGMDGQILCSPLFLDDPDLDVSTEPERCFACLCAPHFEHFVYRFWMENELWRALYKQRALTPEQEAYLAFYSR